MDPRTAKHFINCNLRRMDGDFQRRFQQGCPLFEMVGVFMFPNDLIKTGTINPYFVSGRFPEISRLAVLIIQNKAAIMTIKEQSIHKNANDCLPDVITLNDVFKIIRKEEFPFLTTVATKMLTVPPTTVSCEQSFSRLKHRLHTNMKKQTAFNSVLVTQKNELHF